MSLQIYSPKLSNMDFNCSVFFKCLILILAVVFVHCNFDNVQESRLSNDFIAFERMKNDLFSSIDEYRESFPDSGHDKCLSDLELVGIGLSNDEQWATKSKLKLIKS